MSEEGEIDEFSTYGMTTRRILSVSPPKVNPIIALPLTHAGSDLAPITGGSMLVDHEIDMSRQSAIQLDLP